MAVGGKDRGWGTGTETGGLKGWGFEWEKVLAKSHAEGSRCGADLYVSCLLQRVVDRDKKGYPSPTESPRPNSKLPWLFFPTHHSLAVCFQTLIWRGGGELFFRTPERAVVKGGKGMWG